MVNSKALIVIGRYSLLLFAVIFLLLLYPGQGFARSLEIARVDILAEIMSNGDLKVTENRTIRFNGAFRGADQTIYFNGISLYSEVVVREGDYYYTLVDQFPTSEPGTYSIQVEGDQYFIIDWSFDVYNEDRTFTVEYIARDAVVVHNDTAELYYKFIGDQWDFPASEAYVTLLLPDGAAIEDLRAWGHGPLHGEVELADANKVTWWVAPLPANTYLEGRVLFPVSLVPASGRFSGEAALEAILKEEEQWARQANAGRVAKQYQPYYSLFLFLPTGLILTGMWKRALNRKNAYRGSYYRDLPGDYSPSAAGYLWNKKRIKADYLTAQILNLARLRFIEIEEITGTDDFILREREPNQLPGAHDSLVLEFIFGRVHQYFLDQSSEGKAAEPSVKEITFNQLQKYAALKPREFYNFYTAWSGSAQKLGEAEMFFKDHAFWGWGCLPLVLMLGLALVAFIWWELYLLGAVLLVIPFILLFASPNTYYTEVGADHLLKWRAFRKFLLHFSTMDRTSVPSLVVWEHYLVYAVVLGVAKQVIDQLTLVFPRPETDPTFNQTSWATYGTAHSLAALHSFNRMTSSLNNTVTGATAKATTAIAAASSSSGSRSSGGFSSGGGFGGGFSSGGGGGFGGGGGSFR